MKVLELFAGSRSIGKVAEKLGYKVFSTDLYQFENIDLKKDILQICPGDIPFIPDIIWASPPCTTFSVLTISKNWVKGEEFQPKTEKAKIGIEILNKSLDLINYFLKINPDLIFYIENPRGKMRKSPKLQNFIRHTVTYCQYGFDVMKPTDIWTNNKNWIPKKMCKRGQPCHISSPRGSSSGIQNKSSSFNRSKIPPALCYEVLTNIYYSPDKNKQGKY